MKLEKMFWFCGRQKSPQRSSGRVGVMTDESATCDATHAATPTNEQHKQHSEGASRASADKSQQG
jgi:hypothetical protein